MLEIVDGERYDSDAEGGATVPAKMGCVRADGQRIDVFVKCSWAQCPPGGLVREVVGCLLAQRLSLSVGRPVLVRLPEELTSVVRQIAAGASARMQGSVKPAFGSIALGPGYLRCDAIDPTNAVLRQSALEVWAFDQLILNVDRNARKPNCMTKGNVLAVIDHEKALNVHMVGTFIQPAPWQDEWLSDPAHLFHGVAMGGSISLERLHGQWASLQPADVEQILSAVPESWGTGEVVEGIRAYLETLQQNIDAAFRNLLRVAA